MTNQICRNWSRKLTWFILSLAFSFPLFAKEVALTFDDVPFGSTSLYNSDRRTSELIRKIKRLKLPRALIFAHPCLGKNSQLTLRQIKKYHDSGHIIGNHTCSHPRLDDVGFDVFAADAAKADKLLAPLMSNQKFFRFPMLNEGSDLDVRDKMRAWLSENGYRNGMVSADNEDQFFSARVNTAKRLNKKINLAKVKTLFIDHIISALECDDQLAKQLLGRSPKHVMLLHERDITVMFLEDLVAELRARGWKIIDVMDAYTDKMYFESPKNTFAGYGIVSQLVFEQTGEKKVCYDFAKLRKDLDRLLKL